MNRKIAIISIALLLIGSAIIFLKPRIFSQPSPIVAEVAKVAKVAKVANEPLVKQPVYQIPSAIDQTVDLITGNILKQDNPENLKQEEWKQFNELIQTNWLRYSTKMGKPMMSWSATEVQTNAKKVFYPFSGPDFTTLHQIYPQAEHYVMIAQQRGERLVNLNQLTPTAASQTVEVLSSAWKSFGIDGFFVTEYLFKYISTNKVKIGATTLIASFARLHDFSIQKIVPISINKNGTVIELAEDQSWDSVRFYLVKNDKLITLDYVRFDLSNDGMNENPHHLAFFRESAKAAILLKAASHLPQNLGFTTIRDEILTQSPLIVQDETGLDYRPLNEKFNTVLYGKFVIAHKEFTTYNTELAKAYKVRNDAKELPFRVGYYKDGNYALIVATRKAQN